VTGARAELSADLPAFLERVRGRTQTPLAVGFGISRPEHARRVAAIADGVVVGSALLDLIDRGGDIESFVRSMRAAIDESSTPA
jgi:tryptophan synthase alpha chain